MESANRSMVPTLVERPAPLRVCTCGHCVEGRAPGDMRILENCLVRRNVAPTRVDLATAPAAPAGWWGEWIARGSTRTGSAATATPRNRVSRPRRNAVAEIPTLNNTQNNTQNNTSVRKLQEVIDDLARGGNPEMNEGEYIMLSQYLGELFVSSD